MAADTDSAPYWRSYWIATLSDGRQIPQFGPDGKKFEWRDLPAQPTKITIVPFSKDLAANVRAASKVAALPAEALPIEIEDLGGGLLAGMDERRFTTPTVTCQTCGHKFPFDPSAKAECPRCHDKDEWFCTDCQTKKTEPLVIDNMVLCPDCKAMGKTRGLKRLRKFSISAEGGQFDFQRWVRSGSIEVRVTRNGIAVRPYKSPSTE